MHLSISISLKRHLNACNSVDQCLTFLNNVLHVIYLNSNIMNSHFLKLIPLNEIEIHIGAAYHLNLYNHYFALWLWHWMMIIINGVLHYIQKTKYLLKPIAHNDSIYLFCTHNIFLKCAFDYMALTVKVPSWTRLKKNDC